jgi:hypothetical protein
MIECTREIDGEPCGWGPTETAPALANHLLNNGDHPEIEEYADALSIAKEIEAEQAGDHPDDVPEGDPKAPEPVDPPELDPPEPDDDGCPECGSTRYFEPHEALVKNGLDPDKDPDLGRIAAYDRACADCSEGWDWLLYNPDEVTGGKA